MKSKGLILNEISHEEFTTIINEAESYSKLKKSTRIMKSQRSNIKKDKQIKDCKKMEIDEII